MAAGPVATSPVAAEPVAAESSTSKAVVAETTNTTQTVIPVVTGLIAGDDETYAERRVKRQREVEDKQIARDKKYNEKRIAKDKEYAEKRLAFYDNDEKKDKKHLDKKLSKIEKKWNDYVENANKLGVDPLVFCNQSCSHDCFLEAEKSTYDILTGCLISKCQCFQPKLPKTSEKISFEALLTLKNIILEEENNSDYELSSSSQVTRVKSVIKSFDEEAEATPAPVESEETEDAPTPVDSEEAEEQAEEVRQKSDEKYQEKKQQEEQELAHKDADKYEEKGESIGGKVGEVAGEAKDKISDIAEKGKEKVKEVADSLTGNKNITTEVPPTGIPDTRTGPDAAPIADPKECNLTCFRECIDLKQFVPYPVIQQCINLRCHCTLDTASKVTQKLQGLLQLSSLEALNNAELQKGKPSVFMGLLLTALVLAILAGGCAFLYMYMLDKDLKKQFTSEMDYASEPGYERLA